MDGNENSKPWDGVLVVVDSVVDSVQKQEILSEVLGPESQPYTPQTPKPKTTRWGKQRRSFLFGPRYLPDAIVWFTTSIYVCMRVRVVLNSIES